MGAWGTGVFENDDALDWVYDLEKAKDTRRLVETLETVTKRGDAYLEAPECCSALAAAQVVVALGGGSTPDLPEECRKWVELHRGERPTPLLALSLSAIERVGSNSELKELWTASDEAAKWYDGLSDLEERLKAILDQAAPGTRKGSGGES
jgi:hypothetical protein